MRVPVAVVVALTGLAGCGLGFTPEPVLSWAGTRAGANASVTLGPEEQP